MLLRELDDERGFTLVEVMVVVVIIGTALLSMLSMFELGMKNEKQGEQELMALNLCQEKMETLLASYYLRDHAFFLPTSSTEKINGFSVSTEIGQPRGSLQEVKVTVSYDFYGREKSVTLFTEVVNYH